MANTLLSICIPVYNRVDYFKLSLFRAAQACNNFKDITEIVVSDNGSEEDIYGAVVDIMKKFPDISVIYNKNDENKGITFNILKVASLSSGEFFWMVGSDDFIKPSEFYQVIKKLKENSNISLLTIGFDYTDLNKLDIKDLSNASISLDDEVHITKRNLRNDSSYFNNISSLIDPKYKNVLLGAFMVSIFKKSVWDEFNQTDYSFGRFDSMESIYPHTFIIGEVFIQKSGYHLSNDIITVGEGTREWSTDQGMSIWDSTLPLMHLKTFGDILEHYYKNGLEYNQYIKSKKWASLEAGSFFLPYIYQKYFLRRSIKNSELIYIGEILKRYSNNFYFYYGISRNSIYRFINFIKKSIKFTQGNI